jgi:NTP pyrophosphatase (non-canonical NTP hydrolase)
LELDLVISEIVAFRDERDWRQFHTPHNLATAVAIEVGELQELLLWKSDEEAAKLLASGKGRQEAERELADILIYVLLFCSELGIDPIQAIRCKLAENERKYPVFAAKGNATKYTKLHLPKGRAEHDQYALDLIPAPSPSSQNRNP